MTKEKKHDVYMPLIIGDWLKGTRGMRANVRGVYLSLLLYQWDNGFIPEHIEDLVLIDSEVGSVWVFIFHKFVKIEEGKMQNEKLEEVRNFFSKQKKNGNKGGRPKKNNPNHNPDSNPNRNLHNGIGIDNEVELKKGGAGETKVVGINEALVPAMMKEFKNRNPKYLEQKETDFTSLRSIAEMIHTWDDLTGIFTDLQNHEKIRIRWGEICDHIKADSHYIKYSLSQIEKHFQSIIQSFTNVRNNNSKGTGKDKVNTTGHSGL